jgi:hypothetical protein
MKSKSSKKFSPKKNTSKGNAAAPLQQFFIWHSEKIVAGILVVAALWLAMQGLGYQTLTWQPGELEEIARDTESAIKKSTRTAADEGIKMFDYAAYAKQIKEKIPPDPYRAEVAWKPALYPSPQSRGGIQILTAESLKGEPLRTGMTSVSGQGQDRWVRPSLPDQTGNRPIRPNRGGNLEVPEPIWVNLYGVIPAAKQWEIYDQAFSTAVKTDASLSKPEYSCYELERAEYKPGQALDWQPVVVYPASEFGGSPGASEDPSLERLIPFEQQLLGQLGTGGTSRPPVRGGTSGRKGTQSGGDADSVLLYSDEKIEPAKTYAYRMRLHLLNPNYNLPEETVAEEVDTKSPSIMSDWSTPALVYVPDQTAARLLAVIPPDRADFPRQTSPQNSPKGIMLLEYFDLDMAQALPPVEKAEVVRGSICNMSKEDVLKVISKGRNVPGGVAPGQRPGLDFPDTGLRSNVCIADLSGGRKLQKGTSKEAGLSPDLVVTSKALLLHPNGMMQVASTLPEPTMGNARSGSGYSSPSGSKYLPPPPGSDY